MKCRDLFVFLFSGYGLYNFFGEDKEFLGYSDDEENSVILLKDVICLLFVVGKGDFLSSLSILLLGDELWMRLEIRDLRNSLVVKKEGSRERFYLILLSDFFLWVGKLKI